MALTVPVESTRSIGSSLHCGNSHGQQPPHQSDVDVDLVVVQLADHVDKHLLANIDPVKRVLRRATMGRTTRRDAMDDTEIVKRIGELTDEEQQLERGHASEPLGPDELERLRSLEVALDQCWDLLRQRRARRNAGQDPDDAAVRPATVVEGYQQ